MTPFIAKNHKQLDLCLRFLYSENKTFTVNLKETEKRKIIYEITANDTDQEEAEKLLEKYKNLIS